MLFQTHTCLDSYATFLPSQMLPTLWDEWQLWLLESAMGWRTLSSSFKRLSARECSEDWCFLIMTFLGLWIICWQHQLARLPGGAWILLCHCSGWLCVLWGQSRWGGESELWWSVCFPPVEDEPTPGDVASIAAYQEWAQFWDVDGVGFFHYNSTSEECHLYRNLTANCLSVGAPVTAPAFEECPIGALVRGPVLLCSLFGNQYQTKSLELYEWPKHLFATSLFFGPLNSF